MFFIRPIGYHGKFKDNKSIGFLSICVCVGVCVCRYLYYNNHKRSCVRRGYLISSIIYYHSRCDRFSLVSCIIDTIFKSCNLLCDYLNFNSLKMLTFYKHFHRQIS